MKMSPPGTDNCPEPNLKKMLVVSIFFHALIFFGAFFLPQPHSSPRPFGEIIEVDLVEMPRGIIANQKKGGGVKKEKGRPTSKIKARKRLKTKQLSSLKIKEQPVVIAKKVVKKRPKKKDEAAKGEKFLEEALKKIEKRLEKKEGKPRPDRVEEAVSRLASRSSREGLLARRPGPAAGGIAIEIYKAEVESRIKENWAYPVALLGPDSTRQLEATVILTVRRTGEITKWEFKRRSGDAVFDESVLKAIERSNPLPPFPKGYLRSSDEIEINFNLQDLRG